ncbi:ParB/RepB/Spo0J family partition protein [Caballeronia telluris]|uniref:ParB-like nuclease domain protein n=1 Tax=Caballeronia telluris TaxID=326475 RepID=A0A158KKW0_9BURK|nr:ParB/RepB/Spo0J family partition protein [Caballeronia telluris]SAL81041.1 ParB-like nuclease domain protein [Caballeronia telluris]
MKRITDKGFKAAEATLEDLKIHWAKSTFAETGVQPVPLNKLLVCPKAFQMRHVDPKTKTGVSVPAHVTKLAERLDKEADLDPILVLPISYNRFIIIDGFHRAAAYKRKMRQTIPAVIFTGTPSEAKRTAIKENAKAKLELTSQEKTAYLWTLVKERPLDDHGKRWTLKMCGEASDRSQRLAETMNAYLERCKAHSKEIPEYWKGGSWNEGEDWDGEKVSKSVKELGDKLKEVLGALETPGKQKRAAQALQYALGEASGALVKALVQESGDFGALDGDWEERLAEEREEAVEKAVKETKAQAAWVKDRLAMVEKQAQEAEAWREFDRMRSFRDALAMDE